MSAIAARRQRPPPPPPGRGRVGVATGRRDRGWLSMTTPGREDVTTPRPGTVCVDEGLVSGLAWPSGWPGAGTTSAGCGSAAAGAAVSPSGGGGRDDSVAGASVEAPGSHCTGGGGVYGPGVLVGRMNTCAIREAADGSGSIGATM